MRILQSADTMYSCGGTKSAVSVDHATPSVGTSFPVEVW